VHHNETDYWRHLQSLPPGHRDLPSPRVCRLLLGLFARWRAKPRWLTERQVGHLFRDRRDLSDARRRELAALPVMLRKAHAVARMLELVTDPAIAARANTFHVSPDELIVGTLPPFSVGQGKEFVRYLTEQEELRYALDYLNELSPMGHVVPDHGALLEHGLNGLIAQCRQRQQGATPDQQTFFAAVIISLEAVKAYAARYAAQAEALAASLPRGERNRDSMKQVAANMRHSPADRPQTFHQAVQAVFLLHCAFHWTVEIVPLGRLDQLLYPFYRDDVAAGRLTPEQAQEILDCLWIKFDETVVLNRRHAEDRFDSCDGTLTGYYGPSNYDQGALLNQWMQQVTIGGVVADDRPQTRDASNDLTYLFLECARRLPLNSPTLDLRVHRKTPRKLLEAAALLSGGAHPVLLNDERILAALERNTEGRVPPRSLRNYACDGCYETMFAGETEFSFGFIFALDAIERTLNRGAKLPAGPGAAASHLRGIKDSWRTPPASDLADFNDFWEVMRRHLLLYCHRYLASLLALYGNKIDVAPSPLLSAFLGGCLESGRDLNAGGVRYHLFSPLLVGVGSAADSLYAINALVFGQKLFTLGELLTCLATDWGSHDLVLGRHVPRERIQAIRKLCQEQPKFGGGDPRVDQLAWRLIDTFVDCVAEARRDPVHVPAFERLKSRYEAPGHPFELFLAPGVGTFEQYVLLGGVSGASPDGRPAGGPIGSDMSAAPVPPDEEPVTSGAGGRLRHRRQYRMAGGLASYNHACLNRLGDGAPADYNIPENFSPAKLVDTLQRFAHGDGPSVCTFTVADPETLAAALRAPQEHDLVRVRMGGWTEFFIALFPPHQEQHRRRPLYVP
jgi:pyruvate-formate lyase